MIKSSTLFGALIALLWIALPSHAQDAAQPPAEQAGYTRSAEPVFDRPVPASNFLGTLAKGTWVRLQHHESGWYALYLADDSEAVGYVFGAELIDALPEDITEAEARSRSNYLRANLAAEAEAASDEAGADERASEAAVSGTAALAELPIRYVHQFVNVRSGPSSAADIVAQLPPGAHVHVAERQGGWAAVHTDATEAKAGAAPLGYVSAELLREAPPSAEEQTIVYVTRTGKKYHLKTCRHLRSSQFSMTLEEVLEKNYEPCKVCRPPAREQ